MCSNLATCNDPELNKWQEIFNKYLLHFSTVFNEVSFWSEERLRFQACKILNPKLFILKIDPIGPKSFFYIPTKKTTN